MPARASHIPTHRERSILQVLHERGGELHKRQFQPAAVTINRMIAKGLDRGPSGLYLSHYGGRLSSDEGKDSNQRLQMPPRHGDVMVGLRLGKPPRVTGTGIDLGAKSRHREAS